MTTTIPLVTIDPTAWTVTADGVTLGTVTRTGSVYRTDDPDAPAYGTLSTAAGALLAARADR